ncbi:MAG: hypothetical protein GTO30_14685 [Acidobacteria bacterium]|nr:hypothetical protein [Acidobacteriota bacterium]NIQ86104.1 hypothetical protein [Acidobacteriota bacterium]
MAIVLAIVAIAFFVVNSRGCYWTPGIHDTRLIGAPWGFLGFSGLLQLILGVWVGVDAQKRGSNGYFWGLLVFFTSIIGLLVYLLWVTDAMEKISKEVQQAKAPAAAVEPVTVVDAVLPECPACGGEVEDGFKACPACGAALGCSGCGKTIRKGWKVCPWCTTRLGAGR